MDINFWLGKWEQNDIAFHESEVNPLLVKYFGELSLAKGSRVFVPLCGKTLDIHWLLSNGYRVAGAELSKLAVEQLFASLGVTPDIAKNGELEHYRANNIDIFSGNMFSLTSEMLAPVDAIYDRAAFVALNEETRSQYAIHLTAITNKAPQLLICLEYDQSLMEGPPFSISNEEVNQKYGHIYELTFLASAALAGGLKGRVPTTENVWRLRTLS